MRGRDQPSAERRRNPADRRVDPSSDPASRAHLLPQGEKEADESLADTYVRDGVALLRAALDARALADAQAAWAWSVANPGPLASRIPSATAATFYQDLYNPRVLEGYEAMLARLAAAGPDRRDLGRPGRVVHVRAGVPEGGRRGAAHALAPGLLLPLGRRRAPGGGLDHFEALAAEDSLEFVRGSHRGALYNGSRFTLGDDTAPLHPGEELPRLPDIEADRAAFDIVSFAVEPGDVVLFHPRMLHGGAATHGGQRRRTLTLRFFGHDAVYEARPGPTGPRPSGQRLDLQTGDPLRHPAFLKLA